MTDSKQLTEAKREAMFDRVAGWCIDWAIGHASVRECDGSWDVRRPTPGHAASARWPGSRPDAFLIDGKWNFLPDSVSEEVPRKMLVKGDGRSLSIAAASILAKVTRDRIMRSTAPDHPGFAFEHNKGYPCWRHQAALAGYGPTSIHRRSWAFMDSLPLAGLHRVPPTPAQPSLF